MLDRRRFLLSPAAIAAPSGLPSSIAQAQVVTESEHNPLLLASDLASFDEFKRAHA